LRAAVAAASLLASLAVGAGAGCGQDRAPPGEVTPEVATILGHLPGDAWAVVGINAARVRAIPALAPLLDWLPKPPLDPKIVARCGLDSRQGIDRAIATLGGGGRPDAIHLALQGSFSRHSIDDCVADLSSESDQPIVARQEGSLTAYTVAGKKSHVYWPVGEVLIVAPDAVDQAAALNLLVGAESVKASSRLMGYVGRVRTGAAFWMAGPLPPEVQKQMAGFGPGVPALQGFFLTVDAAGEGKDSSQGEAVRALLGLRLAREKEARAAAEAFRDQRGALASAAPDPRAGAIVKKLEVSQSGSEVALRVSLTAAEVELLADLVAGVSGLPQPAAPAKPPEKPPASPGPRPGTP
jgi:hypothetical protein